MIYMIYEILKALNGTFGPLLLYLENLSSTTIQKKTLIMNSILDTSSVFTSSLKMYFKSAIKQTVYYVTVYQVKRNTFFDEIRISCSISFMQYFVKTFFDFLFLQMVRMVRIAMFNYGMYGTVHVNAKILHHQTFPLCIVGRFTACL